MRLESPNLHYRFYVEYFEDLDLLENLEGSDERTKRHAEAVQRDVEARNNGLWAFRPPAVDPFADLEQDPRFFDFSLYTAYPGLLMGLGNAHEVKLPEAVKLGFSLDYVTGLPWLPGSSLKGQLRSRFQVPELIAAFLDRPVDVGALEKDIFEGGDCFLGAYPVSDGTPMLAPEYITPHPDKLKNPNPISLMKIRPNVCFRFGFLLRDAPELGVSAGEKLALFQTLLEELGVGAKTNVGFGKMTREKAPDNHPGFDNAKLPLIGNTAEMYTKPAKTSPSPDTQDPRPQRRETNNAHGRKDAAAEKSRSPRSGGKGGGEDLGPCPKCGAPVQRNRRGYVNCEARCGLRLGKFYGTPLSDEQLRSLLHGECVMLPDHFDNRQKKHGKVELRLKKGGRKDPNQDWVWWPNYDWHWL